MKQFGVITIGGLLSLACSAIQAETFLNDSALLEQVPEHDKVASMEDMHTDPASQADIQLFTEIQGSSSSSTFQPVDPGFTPSHEVMRETEAKREADDRLWQSIFSAFE